MSPEASTEPQPGSHSLAENVSVVPTDAPEHSSAAIPLGRTCAADPHRRRTLPRPSLESLSKTHPNTLGRGYHGVIQTAPSGMLLWVVSGREKGLVARQSGRRMAQNNDARTVPVSDSPGIVHAYGFRGLSPAPGHRNGIHIRGGTRKWAWLYGRCLD